MKRNESQRRPGIVLIGVLIVVALMSLAAFQYSEVMRAEANAMVSYTRTTQSRALVLSGAHYTSALLADPFAVVSQLGGNPFDNPAMFQDVQVSLDPISGRRGLFSIITLPRPEDLVEGGQQFRYGVSDETGKLNLNALLTYDSKGELGLAMLMKLPNMTEDVANSILDWLDPDETPRAGGAENETYSSMSPAYRCKNGPLDSLEELLLVKGVTPRLLFGTDRNRNGQLDLDEDDGSGTGLDLGWAGYLTVYSAEKNVNKDGEPRDFLNAKDLITVNGLLSDAFPENPEVVSFIMGYRLYGGVTIPEGTTIPELTKDQAEIALAKISLDILRGRGKNTIPTIWDLLSKSVTVTLNSRNPIPPILLPSPFADPEKARTLLPILFDKFTTKKNADLTARINISTAPPTVLRMLPGLTEEQLTKVIGAQPNYSSGNAPEAIYETPAWLFTEAKMEPAVLKSLDKYITTRSQVYRFQILGYQEGSTQMSRAEAVVDSNSGRPRIVFWRDLSELGPAFATAGNPQPQMGNEK